MGFIGEVWRFLASRRKLWLFPVVMVMLIIGALLLVSQSTAVGPLIYTLF